VKESEPFHTIEEESVMKFTTFAAAAFAAVTLCAPSASAQLEAAVQETGNISLSSDGNGNNSAGGGLLQVDKPAGATVRGAYLCAAGNFNRVINDGDVSLNGTALNWDMVAFNGFPGNETFFNNVFADVTSIVKPVVDPAPAGLMDIGVTEVDTGTIDGTVLTVIFDDPAIAADRTVILLFGGQATAGDTFFINTTPLDLSDLQAKVEMGLGISFGFQGQAGTGMISEISVNGQPLTSSAGGEDDGAGENGALLTAGGIGDSTTNPPPLAPSTGLFTDDELYNLLPFVSDGDTQIVVSTVNPSNDDNIFCGYFVTSVPAAIGESILLSPLAATNAVGTDHTVTASVKDDNGDPVAGRHVDFKVLSGPNAGDNGASDTDAAGNASFTYTGDGGVGTDAIVAEMIDSQMVVQQSNVVAKTWEAQITSTFNGCQGSSGVPPLLSFIGSLAPASVAQMDLTGALANATGAILVGAQPANLQREGCTLLFLPVISHPFKADAAGSYTTIAHWPSAVPSGVTVFLQAYVIDAGAPTGFATSNTIKITTP
jgi:hypothetical protein